MTLSLGPTGLCNPRENLFGRSSSASSIPVPQPGRTVESHWSFPGGLKRWMQHLGMLVNNPGGCMVRDDKDCAAASHRDSTAVRRDRRRQGRARRPQGRAQATHPERSGGAGVTSTPSLPRRAMASPLGGAQARAWQADPMGWGVSRWGEHDFRRYLRCGILAHGFARVRCTDRGHERLLAFSTTWGFWTAVRNRTWRS